MRAMILKEQGGIENFSLSNIPMPAAGPDDVLVKVKAISINPADAIVRENPSVKWIFNGEEPMILGWDLSGEVVQTGVNVKEFVVGDEVFGVVRHPGHGKAYAEYVAAPASHLALKPKNITHIEAAVSTLAVLTALQPMRKVGIHKGSRVFISAAGGGVGHFAIQIAKFYGAHVIALASESKRKFVMSRGADEFIDYQTQKFEEVVEPVDLAIDAVRTEGHVLRTLNIVKPGGTLISLWSGVTGEESKKAEALGVRAFYNAIQSSGEDMKFVAKLLEDGFIFPHISRIYEFEQIPEAHKEIESGQTRGKIAVEVC
ncbi:NADP-dependent oxidoreductase [Flavobacterium beibuense]|uniref:Alcohol dehydrogenase zinc-binding domain protein n=1 Tax=Flavobacterium beibuense TaxID=657326 RepID=A0A444WEE9_9FLAO|nr:NADP-dependent oxidoreductase [Flavobacterium beibuense]RYJ44230.1 Alcohol dehydrogenase zinc-binding domain protein [Flavobacterium beibuense]